MTSDLSAFDSQFARRRVLVTGGMGFIGSNLAKRLVDLGSEVVVVDSERSNTGWNPANVRGFAQNLQICRYDMCDGTHMGDLVRGTDYIFNLAGQISHLDSMKDPLADLSANLHSHIVLLEACRRDAPATTVVFASTRQIYGRPTTFPVAETHPIRPVDVNGIHKMAAEAYHTLYNQVYGLNTVSLRLTNTFGPRMYIRDGRQTFLGIWLRRVLEDKAFEVWGGTQKRDLTYVDDVVNAFLCAAVSTSTYGRVFNIGGSSAVSLLELAEILVSLARTGRYEKKEFPAELRKIDIGDYFADDRQFRSATGWSTTVSLQEGLARTLAYYREYMRDYV